MIVRECPSLTHDGDALAAYLRVDWDGSAFNVVAGTAKGVGTLHDQVLSGATKATLVPWNMSGTRKMVAAEAIAAGADVYGAAGGKVGDTVGSNVKVGIAVTAASGDGSVLEVLPIPDFEVAG